MLYFIVPSMNRPVTLRDFLRNQSKLSLTIWRKIKHTGTIEVNGDPAYPGSLVHTADKIHLTWPQECLIQPTCLPLSICYEDDTIIILDKPAGMLVHPNCEGTATTLANAVIYYYRSHNCQAGFHPVHRLDRNTSGLILVAKTPHAQHLLCQSNSLRIARSYLAIITGYPEPSQGTIDKPIGRRPGSIIERMICPNGQPAVTMYRTLHSYGKVSLLELQLCTGRTHQIRVHLSFLGHPLIGDDLYGGSKYLLDRQALHCAHLEFTHPTTGKKISLSAGLPYDMQTVLRLAQTDP